MIMRVLIVSSWWAYSHLSESGVKHLHQVKQLQSLNVLLFKTNYSTFSTDESLFQVRIFRSKSFITNVNGVLNEVLYKSELPTQTV